MRFAGVFSAFGVVAMGLFATPQTRDQAEQMQAHGNWKGAEAAWRALAEQSPNDYRLWTSLGTVLAHEQQYADAIAAYRKALAMRPEVPETELNLGLVYFKSGALREAIEPLRVAAAGLPDNMQATVLLGMSLYGTAQYREAATYLEKVVTRSDGNAQLTSVLAECYLKSGQYELAKSEFEQMLKRDPDSPGVHMMLGETYDALNRRQDAINEFRAATTAKDYVPMAHFGLGYLLWADRRYDEAEAEFRKEIEKNPKNGQAMAYLADAELKKGNRTEAEDLLRRSIQLQPVRVAYFDLGVLATEQKHLTEAIDEFKQAIAIDPKDADAHYRLARIFKELHRTGEAQEQLAIVRQLHDGTRDDLLEEINGTSGNQTKP